MKPGYYGHVELEWDIARLKHKIFLTVKYDNATHLTYGFPNRKSSRQSLKSEMNIMSVSLFRVRTII